MTRTPVSLTDQDIADVRSWVLHEDASVIALDAGATADEGSGASAPHLLATSGAASLPAPRPQAARWPPTPRPTVGAWIADGMERPPKG